MDNDFILFMKQEDFRKKTPAIQRELRELAVREVLEGGKTRKEAARIVGVHRLIVAQWISRYKEIGKAAFKGKVRGRRRGDCMRLSSTQSNSIKKIITDKFPEQYKMNFMLWTRDAVRDLIHKKYDILLPVRTIGDYLKRWGFTAQRPKKRAYEQQPEVVQKWLNDTYPLIKEAAQKENAEIQWADETAVCSNDHRGRRYAPKGKTPIIQRQTRGHRINMISSISNRGTLRFMLFEKNCTSIVFMNFLERLIKGSNNKIFLIVDNHSVHKSKNVKKWLKKNEDKISLYYLPPYAPEHNPDEYLNNAIKQHIGTQPRNDSKPDLMRELRSYMHSLQKNINKIKSFFRASAVCFAA